LGFAFVGRVIFKELPFIIECLADGFIRFNVALATVDDRDVTQTKGDDTTRQNIDNIGPSIHEVNFCEDADGSGPFRVDFSG